MLPRATSFVDGVGEDNGFKIFVERKRVVREKISVAHMSRVSDNAIHKKSHTSVGDEASLSLRPIAWS